MTTTTPVSNVVRLSDIDRSLGRLRSAIQLINEQVGSTSGSALPEAAALLDRAKSALTFFLEAGFDPDLWIDGDGKLRSGGAEPNRSLDDDDLGCIKRLGRP